MTPGEHAQTAYALKAEFDQARADDPERARRASADLDDLAAGAGDAEVAGVAAWVAGVLALNLDGNAEEAAKRLEAAAERFRAAGLDERAATVEINTLHALAVLGRYDEAFACGLRAREVCINANDQLRAGQIEQNLGNICFRRDRYHNAETFYRLARDRFEMAGDERQLGQIDTCLATTLVFQHRFRDAEALYERALARAEQTGQADVQAVIECDLGCLALLKGRYDRALDLLERSRRRYAELGMRHESAVAELELADAYLDVNLVPEAADLYRRVIPVFVELSMRAEQARALVALGHAEARIGHATEAHEALDEARRLYVDEENAVGGASVDFAEAQLHYRQGELRECAESAARADAVFSAENAWVRTLLARGLRGEALRADGRLAEAAEVLASTCADAERRDVPQALERCHTSLGLLAAARGDTAEAEAAFERAASAVEGLRALLPSDEFRTAFVTDKLVPLAELTRLALARGGDEGVRRALEYVERGRSRALADLLSGRDWRPEPRDDFEASLVAEIDEVAGELNWLYNRADQSSPQSGAAEVDLKRSIAERETRLAELTRSLEQCGARLAVSEPFDLDRLRAQLGRDTALVEYFAIDGRLGAFVVTDEGVEVVRSLASEDEVLAAVRGLRIQTAALQAGRERVARHADVLAERARRHAARLYDLVIRPVAERALKGRERFAIVPHGALHYVPFALLFDGEKYLVECCEIAYAPSAAVLQRCLDVPSRPLSRALLVGVPDERAPKVEDEIRGVSRLFGDVHVLLGERATAAALRELAPAADVVHLATHARFRSDNPLFSSLRLADGWLTVRDARGLGLSCGLVTLSACETGMSALAPGDEIMGFARGFLSAGAPSLVATLWTVADAETAEVMQSFYAGLLAGRRPSYALRAAQIERIERGDHPFYWAPFVLLGRW